MWQIIALLFILLAATIFLLIRQKYFDAQPFAVAEPKPFPKEYDLKKITIKEIDRMLDGSDFELYLYRLFLALGYLGVYKTVGSRDFGADIVFTDRRGIRNVIQAKRYSVDSLVGLSAVQEVYTSMKYYKAKKSIVITSSFFTGPCEILAGVNWVKLLDRKDLINIIAYYKQNQIDQAMDYIESEPKKIYETWSEMDNPYREIKKDKKAEKMFNCNFAGRTRATSK